MEGGGEVGDRGGSDAADDLGGQSAHLGVRVVERDQERPGQGDAAPHQRARGGGTHLGRVVAQAADEHPDERLVGHPAQGRSGGLPDAGVRIVERRQQRLDDDRADLLLDLLATDAAASGIVVVEGRIERPRHRGQDAGRELPERRDGGGPDAALAVAPSGRQGRHRARVPDASQGEHGAPPDAGVGVVESAGEARNVLVGLEFGDGDERCQRHGESSLS